MSQNENNAGVSGQPSDLKGNQTQPQPEKSLIEKVKATLTESDLKEVNYQLAENKLRCKILTTLLYKDNHFEDYTKVKKVVNSCKNNCYQKLDLNSPKTLPEQLGKLKECVKTCVMPEEDLKNYYDNVDFMSIFKLEYCAEGCLKTSKPGTADRLDCYFNCYSRLDRRYRVYWLKHRNKLVNRYYNSLYEDIE